MKKILKKILKKIIPIKYYFRLRNIKGFSKYSGNNNYCPVCDTNISRFISIPEKTHSDLFLTDMIIKGKNHSVKNYETFNFNSFFCPICGAQDKVRMIGKYLLDVIDKNRKYSLLHFTPESGLYDLLLSMNNINYKTSDLERKDVDYNFDLHNLSSLDDNSFDIVVCSHILEHVKDDRICLNEIRRILKPSGFAIIMVPIMLTLEHDYEDSSIISSDLRLIHFGQEDHVRLYSKNGFIEKINNAGFKLKEIGNDYFGKDKMKKMGLDSKNVLYVVN